MFFAAIGVQSIFTSVGDQGEQKIHNSGVREKVRDFSCNNAYCCTKCYKHSGNCSHTNRHL